MAMINVICDAASWADLLGSIREQQRFSSPADYDKNLLDTHGRPLLVQIDTLRFHVYPPIKY